MIKNIIFFFLSLAVCSSANAQADFARNFNSRSVPADVQHYTLLVFSPLAEEGNTYMFTDILKTFHGRFEVGSLKSFTEGRYKDGGMYKYALVITKNGIEPNASYSIYITELANRSKIQSANLWSGDWEKLLRFYVNKLNGF